MRDVFIAWTWLELSILREAKSARRVLKSGYELGMPSGLWMPVDMAESRGHDGRLYCLDMARTVDIERSQVGMPSNLWMDAVVMEYPVGIRWPGSVPGHVWNCRYREKPRDHGMDRVFSTLKYDGRCMLDGIGLYSERLAMLGQRYLDCLHPPSSTHRMMMICMALLAGYLGLTWYRPQPGSLINPSYAVDRPICRLHSGPNVDQGTASNVTRVTAMSYTLCIRG